MTAIPGKLLWVASSERSGSLRNSSLTGFPRRQLGVFDATMIVMGGIVGSGIFINPYVVALQVHTPLLILGVWLLGGALAMVGAFIWAELATRLPGSGGQYLYLREAYHPAVAFVYGWVLLLVTQTGGMAAVAVTFAQVLSRDQRIHGRRWRYCRGGAARADGHQLSWRARRQQRAERSDAAEGGGDRGVGGGSAFGLAAARSILPLLDRPVSFGPGKSDWRGHDSGGVRLRRMADGQLRRRRDARSAARSLARTGGRRDRRYCCSIWR